MDREVALLAEMDKVKAEASKMIHPLFFNSHLFEREIKIKTETKSLPLWTHSSDARKKPGARTSCCLPVAPEDLATQGLWQEAVKEPSAT